MRVAERTEVVSRSLGVVGIKEVVVHNKVNHSPEVDQAVINPEGGILVVIAPTVAVVAVVQYLLAFLEVA